MLVAGAAIAQPPGNGNYRLPNDICGCGDAMGVCLDGAPHTERFWVRGEALIWQLEGQVLPALLTFSPIGTDLNEAGRLDSPNTTILTGSNVVNDDWRAGWGISGGLWVDDCRRTALIWDYLQVGRDTFESNAADLIDNVGSPDTDPAFYLTRPFFNVQTGQQGVQLVSGVTQEREVTTAGTNPVITTTTTTTDVITGSSRVQAYEDFYTTGVAFQHRFRELSNHCEQGHSGQMSWIVGYRHYHDDSFLGINTNSTTERNINVVITDSDTNPNNNPTSPADQNLVFIDNTFDRFIASNNFHGAELGLTARVERWGWWLEGLTTFSIGGNRRVVTLEGQTSDANATAGGAPTVINSGLLVNEETNAGRYSDTQATIIPRLRGGVGCQLTPRLSLRSGYSAIIWPDAVRAADHLPPNLAVDPRNLPGAESTTGATDNPRFPGIQGRTIVAHGFDMALELRY